MIMRRSPSEIHAKNQISPLPKIKITARAGHRYDHRRVQCVLTARGETRLARLSVAHLDELRRVGPELRRALKKIAGK
jgi:hypothetical protein